MFSSSYTTLRVPDLRDEYDYIIVGGGTAGCVLANRLSENEAVSVLLVERGAVQDEWIPKVPLFSYFASDGSRSRKSIPQIHVDGREMEIIGGNSLGGSSRVDSMLPAEFNARTESDYGNLDCIFPPKEYTGKGEWAHVPHQHFQWEHSEHIIKASSSLGIPYVEDLDSPFQPTLGCAKMHYSSDRSSRRSSTFTAFLPRHIVQSRAERLHICPNTLVSRIELDVHTTCATAEGVWVQAPGLLKRRLIRANNEVILCAGPIGSPHLLLLSGIGPSDHLREHGVVVKKDLPAVGSHLDHLTVPVQFCVPVSDSLAKLELHPWRILKELFLFILLGLGLLLSPVSELSVFIQSRLLDENFTVCSTGQDMNNLSPGNRPDIEVMPIARGEVAKHLRGGLCFFVAMLRPASMGSVRLTSNDPEAAPAVDPNYLSSNHDVELLRKAVRFALRLKDQMVQQRYPILDYHTPDFNSDQEIDAYVRANCQSTHHYSSTCRMGSSDGTSVVDEQLRVHGIAGLRVADSSVFPEIPSTHLAAATVVAEKCADLLQSPFRNQYTR